MFENIQKETWTIYFVYVFRGIGDNLYYLKRANAHAFRRELSTSVLDNKSFQFPNCQNTRIQKWMFILYVLYKVSFLFHRHEG